MAKELYIFSGLGADERVFEKLDFPGFSVTFIKWITPFKKESIEQYSSRLLEQITTPKPVLIGLSFGGLIAVEAAKQIETEKVMLIASAKTKTEIPFYYRFAGTLRLHKVLPASLFKKPNLITNWFFGARSGFEKKLLKQILRDTDPVFLNWAIDKIVRWSNQSPIQNLFHLHGTSDRILPVQFVHCDATIKNGGHFMTLNKVEEINRILQQQLTD